jgi:N-acetylmuramoyl-L-alanine amidase
VDLVPVTAATFEAGAGLPPGLASRAVAAPVQAPPRERLRIVLDPGHGGIDPGAVRGDVTEADLVLRFARELAEALGRTGRADVVLTRQADVFVPLPTRVTLARAAGADAFVSIHADALAEQHDRADLLQGIDLSTSDDVVAGVLMDLARVETAPRAEELADTLVESLRAEGIRLHSRPRGEAGFNVLRAADIPSVLVELGFMSDAGDLENLRDPAWRAAMQAALVEGLLTWAEEDALRASLLRQ